METSLYKTKDNITYLLLRYVMIARILAGHYNEYFNFKPFRFLARLYCFLITIVVTAVITMLYDRRNFYPFPVCLIHFLTNVFVSMVTGEQYFFDYCSRIREISLKRRLHLSLNYPFSRLMFKLTTCVKAPLLLMITAAAIYGYKSLNVWILYTTASFLWTSLNISHIIQLQIFEISYRTMKKLKIFLRKNLNYCRGQDKVRHDIKIIKESISIYKCLFENVQATFVPVKILMAVCLCCNFIRLLFTFYAVCNILTVTMSKNYTLFASVMIEDVYACVMMCLPAILIDKTSHEVDKMKIVLGDQLLVCEDDRLRVVLEEALDYLDMCPIKVTICRAVTIDATLPFAFASLCTTYLVVIFQMVVLQN